MIQNRNAVLLYFMLSALGNNLMSAQSQPVNSTQAHLPSKNHGCRRVVFAMYNVNPFSIWTPNGKPTGADVDIWNALAERLGLCLEFRREKNANSAFQKVVTAKADVVVGQPTLNWQRLQKTIFSTTVGMRKFSLGYRNPRQFPAVWTLFYPLDTATWIMLIIFIFGICAIVLVFSKKKGMTVYQAVALSLSSFVSESLPHEGYKTHVSSTAKIILYVWLPMSCMLSHFYKSGLLEFLVAGELEEPVDTFQKILDNNLMMVIPKGTILDNLLKNAPIESMRQVYQKGVLEKGGHYKGFKRPQWVLDAMEAYETGFIFAPTAIYGYRHLYTTSQVEEPIGLYPTGYIFNKNTSLPVNKIDDMLRYLVDTGIVRHLYDKYLWHKAKTERDYYRAEVIEENVKLSLEHVGFPSVLVLACGLVASLFGFMIEFVYKPKRKVGQQSTHHACEVIF